MSLDVKKIEVDSYSVRSFNRSGKLEWESEEPLSAEELMKVLVTQFRYHQLDVFDALQSADPERFASDSNISRKAESVTRISSDNERIGAAKALVEDWLRRKNVEDEK